MGEVLKRFFISACLFLFLLVSTVSPCFADGYYYSNEETTVYSLWGTMVPWSTDGIVCGETGNITKLGVHCQRMWGVDVNLKIALYNDDGSVRLHTGDVVVVSADYAWYEVDISGSPVAVNVNDVVTVACDSDGDVNLHVASAGSAGAYQITAYASFPTATLTSSDSMAEPSTRVYIVASGEPPVSTDDGSALRRRIQHHRRNH